MFHTTGWFLLNNIPKWQKAFQCSCIVWYLYYLILNTLYRTQHTICMAQLKVICDPQRFGRGKIQFSIGATPKLSKWYQHTCILHGIRTYTNKINDFFTAWHSFEKTCKILLLDQRQCQRGDAKCARKNHPSIRQCLSILSSALATTAPSYWFITIKAFGFLPRTSA